MYLTRKNASTSLPTMQHLQTAMNRLFEDTFDDAFGSGRQRTMNWAPPVEIFETEEQLVFQLELPGFEKDQVSISYEHGQLTFSGERKDDAQPDRNYHRNERWYGRFERSFQLPISVDFDKISANLQHGILKVAIPKKEEAKARQIPVKVD